MIRLLQWEDVMFGNKSAEERNVPPQQTYHISFILKSPQRRQQSLIYLWSSGVITTGDAAKSTTRLLVICVLNLWGLYKFKWNHLATVLFMISSKFSCSVVSNSLWPHKSQHTRPPCPSPTPRVYPNSCPSSRWCHPAISSSVIPFSSCPQSLPASESFPVSQLFAWGGQSIGVSALASVLPKNTQDWSPLEWTGWIFLQSKGLSRVFSNTTVQKHQFFGTQLSSQSNSHIHTWPLEKP